jgi:hypothetical protein
MKKYYLVSTMVWLVFTVFALVYAIYKVSEEGADSWVYFLAFGLAVFLFYRRYKTWKNLPDANQENK